MDDFLQNCLVIIDCFVNDKLIFIILLLLIFLTDSIYIFVFHFRPCSKLLNSLFFSKHQMVDQHLIQALLRVFLHNIIIPNFDQT